MPNTFSQIYIHLVFAVKLRDFLIRPYFSEALEKYTTGIVKNKGAKMLAIKAMPDHMHLFISIQPDTSISGLVRDVKAQGLKSRQGSGCRYPGYRIKRIPLAPSGAAYKPQMGRCCSN